MTTRVYATTSGIIFVLVALAHLTRVAAQWDMLVGSWSVPSWASLVAVVVAGCMGYWGLRISAASR